MSDHEINEIFEDLNKLTGVKLKGTDVSGDDVEVSGTIPLTALKRLVDSLNGRDAKERFYREAISGDVSPQDLKKRAKSAGVPYEAVRNVIIVETEEAPAAADLIKEIFPEVEGNFIMLLKEDEVLVIRALESEDTDINNDTASIVSMINTELMTKARAASGTMAYDISGLFMSFKEAVRALFVADIFYGELSVISCDSLGMGRLVSLLERDDCRRFLEEYGGEGNFELNDETAQMVNCFFKKNLNISETARELFLHRNTLVYHIEKLKKKTGLDIRDFSDAYTLKTALMIKDRLDNGKDMPL